MPTLTIDGRADVAAAAAEVDSLAASVRGLGTDVDTAAGQASAAGANFDALGEGSDNVASKSSQAAAGLGDLAGGLEAVGATGAATALQGVALASSVAAGAGDVMNLVAETSVGRYVLQTAASIAHRTATIAGAVATGAMTAAQAALNLVMSANPVALVVIAIVALAAGLILAYQKSETFRDIVDAAFGKAKGAVEDVVDVVKDVIDIVGDLPGKVDDVAGIVAGHFATMFAPILTAIGWVQDLIDKIGSIDFPNAPDLNPFDRTATGEGVDPNDPRLQQAPPLLVGLTLSVAPQDKDTATRDLVDGLREYFARRGQTLVLTEAPA